jgi:hypothetical protein
LDPQVGVNEFADAVFVWRRSNGSNFRAQTRLRGFGGGLTPVQNLSAAGENAYEPQVAVDDTGNAVFTWRRSDGATFRIESRARSFTGSLSAVQLLSDAGQDAFSPQVDSDADGDAVFVWERFDGSVVRVQAQARSSAGTLSGVQTLSAGGQDAFAPQVSVEVDGDAVFVWERFDGTNSRIQSRTRIAGVLGSIQNLSTAGQDAEASQVAVDLDGDAVATWQRFDGADLRVQAAAGP